MAYFAKLDATNIVVHVERVDNDNVIDPTTGQESEAIGIAYLEDIFGTDSGPWVQCSYNATFRGCYPGIGYSYDSVLDVFVAPEEPVP